MRCSQCETVDAGGGWAPPLMTLHTQWLCEGHLNEAWRAWARSRRPPLRWGRSVDGHVASRCARYLCLREGRKWVAYHVAWSGRLTALDEGAQLRAAKATCQHHDTVHLPR